VPGSEISCKRAGLFIDQEVTLTLAVQGDRPGLVPGHGRKAEPGEKGMQELGIGCCEFDEFEAIHPLRVLESGHLHADIGLGTHGILLGKVGSCRHTIRYSFT